MKTGHAIIGANYGDEGKGLMTDYLASKYPEDTLIVRYNGGAQAGHTVVTPEGKRHVFSHFGAASFLSCPTHLSRFFIVNPLLFCRESVALASLGLKPQVSIDSRAFTSTPLDMIINQTCERSRGSARHGSCGLGINETVTRCLGNSQNATRVEDLLRPQQLRKKLAFLKQTWFYARLEELSISDEVSISDDDLDEVLECFLLDVEAMLDSVTITSTPPVRNRIIFEGAQGLLLDEARIDLFPHVTRSRPGLANVVHLADSCGIEQLTVTYVTRSYLTRHGAGPLPGESTLNFADLTNVENAFQGRLRFAPLDLGRLKDTIEADLKLVAGKNVMANIALTCLDQHDISPSTDLEVKYMSYGPARTDVEHRIGRRSFLASKKTSYSSRFAIAK